MRLSSRVTPTSALWGGVPGLVDSLVKATSRRQWKGITWPEGALSFSPRLTKREELSSALTSSALSSSPCSESALLPARVPSTTVIRSTYQTVPLLRLLQPESAERSRKTRIFARGDTRPDRSFGGPEGQE